MKSFKLPLNKEIMRHPVAYGFYPPEPATLRHEVENLLNQRVKRIKALGAVVPHAGYAFSGKVAGAVYASIETNKKKFLIACPNHTGYGTRVALSQEDWQTPLGIVKVDKSLASKVTVNEDAHTFEHAIEVQLPFLQVRFKDFRIIPLCLAHLSFDELEELSKKIIANDIFYIASSDFIHFGPNYGYMPVAGSDEENLAWAKEQDMKAIDLICKLKPKEFYEFVVNNELTICGFVAITLVLLIMKKLGAKKGEIIKYATSYDVHPDSSFVTYAGIVFS